MGLMKPSSPGPLTLPDSSAQRQGLGGACALELSSPHTGCIIPALPSLPSGIFHTLSLGYQLPAL